MRYAVFTVSLPEYTPDEAVRVLREEGYDGVEWRIADQDPSPSGAPGFWAGNRCTWPLATFVEDAPRIRALSEAASLALPSVATYVTCEDLAAAERVLQGVARVGAPQVRISVPKYDGATSYLRLYDRSVAQYREVAALARQSGVRALVELHHATVLPSASSAARFVQNFDPRDVGVIYDAGNMVYEGYETYRLGLEVLGPYVAMVHVKNARWREVGTRPDGSAAWQAEWTPLTQGVVDMAALARALRQVGYDGWLSFEDFSTKQPLRDRLRDNLAYARRVMD